MATAREFHTRAFLSVDFEKDGGDDLTDLTPAACLGIIHWSDFYLEKDRLNEYKFLGLHAGRFYDRHGKPTDALLNFTKCVARGEKMKRAFTDAAEVAPNCTRTVHPKDLQRVGTWNTVECLAPTVPRRCGIPGQESRCICVHLPPVDPCYDVDGQQCKLWAEKGLCEEENAEHIRKQCARSCSTCIRDPDDEFLNAPKKWAQCDREAHTCTVRTK